MATIPIQTFSKDGVVITAGAAAEAGDQFPNNGKTLYKVINGDGSSTNVTITPQNTVNGLTLAPVIVAVAGGATKYLGPYEPQYFNNSSGRAVVTYSSVTSLTVAAVTLP